jgi:hypothetical protein
MKGLLIDDQEIAIFDHHKYDWMTNQLVTQSAIVCHHSIPHL